MPKISSDEYTPAEDTFFLADHIQDIHGDTALDVGSGSGYLTKLLANNFSLVVGTEINYTVIKNQTYKTDNLICCNGSDALLIKFDLIICNMPYLATDEILDVATDGGEYGIEIPKNIINSVYQNMKDTSKFLFVVSSLSDFQRLINYAKTIGLSCRVIAKKKLFFEELIIIESVLSS